MILASQVRTDMVETSIYICAPEVLMLFSDNFDYQVGLSSCLLRVRRIDVDFSN